MIPNLEHVLSEQKDLAALCADRPLQTNEIFQPNAFYGSDHVLKAYANLPARQPLKVVLTHGVQINEDYVWEAEIRTPLPVILVYPLRLVPAYRRKSGKITFHAASSFLYVDDLLADQPKPARQGTIFFLSHSTHWTTARSDDAAIARLLEALPERFHPVTVCIYWRDFNLGHHDEFARRGFRVVSAGHVYDPVFQIRLYHLCSLHRYACSNEFGTHLFFSVKAGCSYFHLNALEARNLMNETGAETFVVPAPKHFLDRLKLFEDPGEAPTRAQLDFIDEYVGAEHKLSRDRLRAFLEFCDALDRWGAAAWENRTYLEVPTALKRTLWHGGRRFAKKALRTLITQRSSTAERI